MKKFSFIFLVFLAFPFFLFSQYTFSGQVLDKELKYPIIGANLIIEKMTIGTYTDIDGKYMLSNYMDSTVILNVSYTGYKSIHIKVTSSKFEKIYLEPSELIAQEVIVSAPRKREKVQEAPASISVVGAKRFGRSKKRKKRNVANRQRHALQRTSDYNPPKPAKNEQYYSVDENQFHQVIQEPLSTFSIDVDAASYSNLRRFLNNGQSPPIDAVRIEEMINYFDYDYPQPKGQHPFEVVTEISSCPWNNQHRLVHIGLQGKKVAMDNLPPSNLVFLLDVSGSMQAANKLPLLQKSLKLLVNQLRKEDKVSIVVYAGAAGVVLPSTKGTDRQTIKLAIDKLQAGGSTAGAAGIQLAYQIARENFMQAGNNRVILATDGDFNVGVNSNEALVKLIEKERKSGVFLTVLGFGDGNYQDHKMQELADKGNGNHAYIDNLLEAKKVLVKEFGGTLFTIAKEVKLQIEFNPAKVQSYRLIGYENRILAAEDFNNDLKDAGELGADHTVTALYEVIPTGVKSVFSNTVDPLKYQKNQRPKVSNNSKEIMTIKLRYKKPDGVKSRLIERPIIDNQITFGRASDNFRFSAAVAEFGLLLKDSEFKSEANFKQVLRLAKSGKGIDENGYRAEFIRLIEMAELMNKNIIAERE